MDEKELVQNIISKQTRLAKLRQPFESKWEDITNYLRPYFNFNVQKYNAQPGSQSTAIKVYNGSPINTAKFFAHGLQGNLVNQSMVWFRNTLEFEELNNLADAKEWLQAVDKVFMAEFNKTNFYNAVNNLFSLGGTICTATLYAEEDIEESRICYDVREPLEIYIDINKYNKVDTVYRKIKMTARVAAQYFGKDALTLNMREALEKNNDTEFEFIHAVEPRTGRNVWKRNGKNKKYISAYICTTENKLIREGGYDVFPFVVWRPEKDRRQVYGGGPGINALVDITGLNLITKDLLDMSHQAVRPAMIASENLRGRIRYMPGGITYKESETDSIDPFPIPTNFPVGIDREEKIESIIEKHFFVDFFILLSKSEKQMTATEIVELQGEKAVMLGPIIASLNDDVLNPLFDLVFAKLGEAGKLPPPPPSLARFGGQNLIKVDYLGPLAQAQKKMFQNQGLRANIEALGAIMQFKPEIVDLVDWDILAREILDGNGTSAKAIKSPEFVAKVRQARQQLAQQQQALATMGAVADSAGKINKATEPGSMLEDMQNQLRGGR